MEHSNRYSYSFNPVRKYTFMSTATYVLEEVPTTIFGLIYGILELKRDLKLEKNNAGDLEEKDKLHLEE